MHIPTLKLNAALIFCIKMSPVTRPPLAALRPGMEMYPCRKFFSICTPNIRSEIPWLAAFALLKLAY